MNLQGKRALVMGVANDKSIAWGIAKALHEAGAELAFTYQGEAFGKRVQPLAASLGSDVLVDADVTDDASVAALVRILDDVRSGTARTPSSRPTGLPDRSGPDSRPGAADAGDPQSPGSYAGVE